MTYKYKCENHSFKMWSICRQCKSALEERHDRMLEHLKYLAFESLDRQNEVELISEECRELLREIGELND